MNIKKMVKKNKTVIYIVVGVAVVLALFIIMNPTILSKADDFISIKLYDSEGKLITTTNSLSTVGGTPGVSYISVDVTATNTGTKPLTCSITTSSPSALDTALSKIPKVLPATGSKKVIWSSSLISVAPLEALPQPISLSATVRCNYQQGTQTITLADKVGSLPINVISDVASASFDVGVDTGGVGTEYCGDGTCQSASGEDALTCPADCATAQNVKFRTSDTAYVAGAQGIAYTTTCGNTLTPYGYSASSGTITGNCTTRMPTQAFCGTSPALVSGFNNLPGAGFVSGGSNPSLWKPTEVDRVCVCDDSGPNTGDYRIRRYSTTSSYVSQVDISAPSFDIAKELVCP